MTADMASGVLIILAAIVIMAAGFAMAVAVSL